MNAHGRAITLDNAGRFLVDTEPYLSCEECFELMDRFVEAAMADARPGDKARPVDTARFGSLRAHLAGCPACAEETAALVELVAAESGTDPAPVLRTLHG